MATAEHPASMNDANERDPENNNSYGTLFDREYVPVDLPVSEAKPQPKPDKPIYVTIKSDLSLAVGNDPATWTNVAQAINSETGEDRKKRLFLRADKTVPYGELMRLMNVLRAAGYLKVALVGLEGAPQGRPEPVGLPPTASPASVE